MAAGTMPTQTKVAPADPSPAPLQPMNAPLVRFDSGQVCPSCDTHIDTCGQCRCSD